MATPPNQLCTKHASTSELLDCGSVHTLILDSWLPKKGKKNDWERYGEGSSDAIPLAAGILFLYTARALLGAVPVGPWG